MFESMASIQNYLPYIHNQSIYYSSKEVNEEEFNIPPLPSACWHISKDRHWTYVSFAESDIPEQGWKIHLSATPKDAQEMLFVVARFLYNRKRNFKFVSTYNKYIAKCSKYANRAASGKFITVYPESEKDFCELIVALEEYTKNFSCGPYILNDKQWKSSCVFFRYGGLQRIESDDNKHQLMIKDPQGNKVPDLRVPRYVLPEWIKEPEEIHLTNRQCEIKTDFFDRYEVQQALHYSNAGGVYLAINNGEKIVIKEGRSGSGLDAIGNDGFVRIRNEYHVLNDLRTIDGVVQVREFETIWKNNYLVEDFVNGITLNDFVARNYPFVNDCSDVSKYVEDVLRITDSLERIINEIHNHGYAVVDLSPSNILIENDTDKVYLVDFEVAQPASSVFHQRLVTPGFYSSQMKTCAQQDWFAFYKLLRFMFLPVCSYSGLAPTVEYTQNILIKKRFGTAALQLIFDVLLRHPECVSGEMFDTKLLTANIHLNDKEIHAQTVSLARSLVRDSRVDRYPSILGDISQYSESLGIYNISHGFFGVLLALLRTSSELSKAFIQKHSTYISMSLAYIKSIAGKQDVDYGLFSGLSGIAMVLIEMQEIALAKCIMEKINEKNLKHISTDISVYSGMSGIGFALLEMFLTTSDTRYLEQAGLLSDRLFQQWFSSNKQDIDLGLITGWSGACLFLWKYGRIINKSYVVDKAFDICLSLVSLLQYDDNSFVCVKQKNAGRVRINPYISTGSLGIALALLEIIEDDPSRCSEELNSVLSALFHGTDLCSSYNSGLFEGYASFVIGSIVHREYYSDVQHFNDVLDVMSSYLLADDKGNLYIPGSHGLRCSMDYATGTAGVILALADVDKRGRWNSWWPLSPSIIPMFCIKEKK